MQDLLAGVRGRLLKAPAAGTPQPPSPRLVGTCSSCCGVESLSQCALCRVAAIHLCSSTHTSDEYWPVTKRHCLGSAPHIKSRLFTRVFLITLSSQQRLGSLFQVCLGRTAMVVTLTMGPVLEVVCHTTSAIGHTSSSSGAISLMSLKGGVHLNHASIRCAAKPSANLRDSHTRLKMHLPSIASDTPDRVGRSCDAYQ